MSAAGSAPAATTVTSGLGSAFSGVIYLKAKVIRLWCHRRGDVVFCTGQCTVISMAATS